MCLSFLVFDVLFKAHVALRSGLSLLHATLHVLDELGQLPIFLVFFVEGGRDVGVLSLHLTDDSVTLLELLLNNLELLWVSKGVLGSNDFLKLMA